MREARLLVCEDAEVVCSVRMVVLYAMHEYSSGDAEDEEAIVVLA
jgi:hypothetical protein